MRNVCGSTAPDPFCGWVHVHFDTNEACRRDCGVPKSVIDIGIANMTAIAISANLLALSLSMGATQKSIHATTRNTRKSWTRNSSMGKENLFRKARLNHALCCCMNYLLIPFDALAENVRCQTTSVWHFVSYSFSKFSNFTRWPVGDDGVAVLRPRGVFNLV
jgi:hypothetical protein